MGKKTCLLSNLFSSDGQEIWTQQSLMWQEVKLPRRDHWLLHFHGNSSDESSLPYCFGHLLSKIVMVEQYIFGPVFKVHCGRSENWNKCGVSEQSQLASHPPSASGQPGHKPYNYLCKADSSLIHICFSWAECWLSSMFYYSFRNKRENSLKSDVNH